MTDPMFWPMTCLGVGFAALVFGILTGYLACRQEWLAYCVRHKAGKWTVNESTGEPQFKLNNEK